MDITNYTRIPIEIIKEFELSPKEILIATTLLTTLNSKNICTFNLQIVNTILHVKDTNTRARNEIKTILKSFKQLDLFTYYDSIFLENQLDIDKIDKNTIIYALYNNYIDSFTAVKDEEIYNVIEYSKKNKLDTSSLLYTLIYILSFISTNKNEENYKLAYPSINSIAEKVGISENSVLKYINVLKDLNILVFDYVGLRETRDGQIRNSNMYYSRKEDEEILLSKLKTERSKNGFVVLNKLSKDKANLKRKLKQEINCLSKKDKPDTIEENKLVTLKEEYEKLNTTAPAED